MLRNKWVNLWGRLGIQEELNQLFFELIKSYSQKHRYYHNLTHIEKGLSEFDSVKEFLDNPDELEMAWWFHDIIYDPKRKDNEEKSARFASRKLTLAGIGDKTIDTVKRLILTTKHHETETDLIQRDDEKYIVDIDLSILGKPREEFDEYERNIRKEYYWASDEHFREGRSRILKMFINRTYIYHTDFFRQKYEEQARMNIERSLIQL